MATVCRPLAQFSSCIDKNNWLAMLGYLVATVAMAVLTTAAETDLEAERPSEAADPALSFSAGFATFAVLQRGDVGAHVYGFSNSTAAVTVAVSVGGGGGGGGGGYTVDAEVRAWVNSSSVNDTHHDRHGDFVWRATLRPQPEAGGSYTIMVATAGQPAINISDVTYGDVYFCSGQSNMALEMYYSFSAEQLKAEVIAGNYPQLRTYRYGFMAGRVEAAHPQYVTAAFATEPWSRVSESAALPDGIPGRVFGHSAFTSFSATCMYFGAELVDARRRVGLDAQVSIGLIQSAIGGTMIEEWMSDGARAKCTGLEWQGKGRSKQTDENGGGLFRGMIAPFLNYSVAGWVWYQGENNCHGVMGNVLAGTGYGCAMPTLIDSWRGLWSSASSSREDERLFGIATLAAGGSEGAEQNMAGMRWSQTANFGRWTDNPSMPNTFGAQVYDIGDPWAHAGEGNGRVMNASTCEHTGVGPCAPVVDPATGREMLGCCWQGITNCTQRKPCYDYHNCSLPEPATGRYGAGCVPWTDAGFLPTMQPQAQWVRKNAPVGIPGNNFMGSIHPRLKRPVGQRLAQAAAAMLKQQQQRRQRQRPTSAAAVSALVPGAGAFTGPTIAGCSHGDSPLGLELLFNTTLLNGEGLLLQGSFDANLTGGWYANPYNDSSKSYHVGKAPSYAAVTDSLGVMVCAAGPAGAIGNASTCACQGWGWVGPRNITNATSGVVTEEFMWYCRDGPGWKPTQYDLDTVCHTWKNGKMKCAMNTAPNPFVTQWRPAPLNKTAAAAAAGGGAGGAGTTTAVLVDLAVLGGEAPVAVRLAWPLFGGTKGVVSDTCCPTRSIQNGHGICLPGSCPLYTDGTNLPANPFFAVIAAGKCKCNAPQVCDA